MVIWALEGEDGNGTHTTKESAACYVSAVSFKWKMSQPCDTWIQKLN